MCCAWKLFVHKPARASTLAGLCLVVLMVSATVVLVGCNTVRGVGKDVEAIANGGQDIIDGK